MGKTLYELSPSVGDVVIAQSDMYDPVRYRITEVPRVVDGSLVGGYRGDLLDTGRPNYAWSLSAIESIWSFEKKEDEFFGLTNRKLTDEEIKQIAVAVADEIAKRFSR